MNKLTFRAGITLAALCLQSAASLAQTWTGAVDNNWSNAGNWSGTAPTGAPGSTDVITLGTASPSAPVVDAVNPWNLLRINFAPNAGDVTLTGNDLQFTAGGSNAYIINAEVLGTFTHTIANNMTLLSNVGTQIQSGVNTGGNLVITGNITATSVNNSILFRGDGNNSIFSGTLKSTADTDVKVSKTDGGTWVFSGTGSKIKELYIANGSIKIGATNALGTSNALEVVLAGSGTTLDLNGYNQEVANLSTDTPVNGANLVTNTAAEEAELLHKGNSSHTYASRMEGNLAFTKQGNGTLILSGVNTYTGQTTQTAGSTGTLLVNGSHTVSSGTGADYNILGGTLGGSGIVDLSAVNSGITLESGARLSPGSGTGVASTFTASLGTGIMDISGAVGGANIDSLLFDLGAAGASDRMVLTTGTLDIGTGVLAFDDFNFNVQAGFAPGTYTLFDTNQLILGSLAASGLSGTLGGYDAILSMSGDGQDLLLSVVPEPGSTGLIILGAAFLGLARRTARRQSVL